MKQCEFCGVINNKVYGKAGKFKMDLCIKHMRQMERHGNFLERTIYDPNEFIINGNTLEIIIYDKKGVALCTAVTDAKNYNKINKCKWGINSQGYIWSRIDGKMVRLHRLITNAPKGMEVDHINHNKLDNREDNLRICTHQQNQYNQVIHFNNTSGYKGVSWDKRGNKWRSKIVINGKQINLGSYSDILEAAESYKKAEIKYKGQFKCQVTEVST